MGGGRGLFGVSFWVETSCSVWDCWDGGSGRWVGRLGFGRWMER